MSELTTAHVVGEILIGSYCAVFGFYLHKEDDLRKTAWLYFSLAIICFVIAAYMAVNGGN